MKTIQKNTYLALILKTIKMYVLKKDGEYFSFTLKINQTYEGLLKVTATNHEQNLYSLNTTFRKLNKYICRVYNGTSS